jgi:hypothetical protein
MNIKNQIPTKLLTDLHSVKIVQLMPSADGGMPHTRPGNIICYPDIVQLQSVSTLIHELWHCHQRTYNDYWLKVFQNLGWYKWNGKLPDKLENARRYNPDTLDCPYWIFDNKWVPIPIFKDITRPNVSQVEIWFYDTEKSYHITYIPTKLKLLFPNLPISAYEHPRELTAYLLSDPFKYRNSPGFIHLIKLIGQTAIS